MSHYSYLIDDVYISDFIMDVKIEGLSFVAELFVLMWKVCTDCETFFLAKRRQN